MMTLPQEIEVLIIIPAIRRELSRLNPQVIVADIALHKSGALKTQ